MLALMGPRAEQGAQTLAGLVEAMALEQFGVISRSQVLALGATRAWIETRLRTGRWQRPFPGLYVVFTGPMPFRTRVTAALLRAGPGAVARGATAAALDGLAAEPATAIHVLVPARRRVVVEPPIVVRRGRSADQQAHPTRRPGRTRIEETVLDLCEESGSAVDVSGWVTRAVGRRLTTPARLGVALRARSRHRWRRLLLALLADVDLGAQSPLELEYLRSVERAHHLPAGSRQVRWAGHRTRWVDVDLDQFGVRIELDGRLGHIEDGAFRDRQRDNEAARSGRASLRYGWGEVFGSPCDVAAEVAGVLMSRGWAGYPQPCRPGCSLRVDDRGRSDSSRRA
jgi:hypothetical protein